MIYELIDHTADFGLRVRGGTCREVFEHAALAVSDLIVSRDSLTGEFAERLSVEGEDRPELMFNWLREILYLWHGKEWLVRQVSITELSDTGLAADLRCDAYHPERHAIKNEIKAVTYHQLAVNPTQNGWEALVILDV